ncbi:MAG: hypothetical protein JNJ53_11630 [Rhizobiales bacterium]|nr:hypothetical protein [Hyphomicrobiales bacterium]
MRTVIVTLLVVFQLTILPVMAKVAKDGGALRPHAMAEGGLTVVYQNAPGLSVGKMRRLVDVPMLAERS